MSSFIEVEFPVIINLTPDQFHKGMYDELDQVVKKKYSGIAHAKIGYIKPGSVQIVSKQMGKYEGSHLTGNMSFHLLVRCLATMPLKDMIIDAIVIRKNDAGLVCKNFMYPYSLFVPNIPGDPESNQLSSINTNDSVKVKVIDSRLKAPNLESRGEKAKPEYWVICNIASINTDAISRVNLPQAEKPSIFATYTTDMEKIEDDRNKITGGMFKNLKEIKNVIDTIRKDYVTYIKSLKNIMDDPIIRCQIKPNERFIIGIIKNHKDNKADISILLTDKLSRYEKSSQKIFNLPPTPSVITDDSLVLLALDKENNVKIVRELDMWLLHVKYIINPNEMIHITNTYQSQILRLGISDEKIQKSDNVISRAYYKMSEFLGVYGQQLIRLGNSRIACIAESPGGFIQALIDKRRNLSIKGDIITGISLSPNIGRSVWDDFKKLHQEKYSDTVLLTDNLTSTSDPKTTVLLQEGDLTVKETRDTYSNLYAYEYADLVTADGGFERDKLSADMEELDTAKLLLAEMSMALKIQATGGSFILKIFDMATNFTVDILSILAYCYENVSIIKPKTSRIASSEKYVVCIGFKISREEANSIVNKLEEILYANKEGYYYGLIMTQDADIRSAIVPYNTIFMKKQSEFIITGREYATHYMDKDSHQEELMKPYVREQSARAKKFYSDYK